MKIRQIALEPIRRIRGSLGLPAVWGVIPTLLLLFAFGLPVRAEKPIDEIKSATNRILAILKNPDLQG
ncbi:MAG: hypothetical protein M1608_14615, partial [Candidatus Omnitrophica bacterium]|nr:hypothetical protein [Candidatus Omnitrophota bacterium]